MFDVANDPPDIAWVFGQPAPLVALGGRTIVQLWPHKEKHKLDHQGLPFESLCEFIQQGLVSPLIQDASRYCDCPWVVPLIRDHHPPNYFWRSNMIYSIIAGGDENCERIGSTVMSGKALEWMKLAGEHPVIKRSPYHRDSWEPHHKKAIKDPIDDWGMWYIQDSFRFKYVNAAAFLGEDFVKTLLDHHDEKKALRFLTTFHILTDHPISHSLLTNSGVNLQSDEWKDFSTFNGEYFFSKDLCKEVDSIPLKLLAAPTYREIVKMLEAGVRPLPKKIFARSGDISKDELDRFHTQMKIAAMKYNAWEKNRNNRTKTWKRIFGVSIFGGAGITSISTQRGEWIAAAALLHAILESMDAVNYVMDCLNDGRFRHLVTRVFEPPNED